MGLITRLKEWRQRRQEEELRRQGELDRRELICHRLKMRVLEALVESRPPVFKESVALRPDCKFTLGLRIETWAHLKLGLEGHDFYECVVKGDRVVRTKTDSIPRGLLFSLVVTDLFPEWLGHWIQIFVAGRKFYTVESRSYTDQLHRWQSSTKQVEYFWPADLTTATAEYAAYKLRGGLADDTQLKLMREWLKQKISEARRART